MKELLLKKHCPICQKKGIVWDELLTADRVSPRVIYSCTSCFHKWIENCNKNSGHDLQTIEKRSSSSVSKVSKWILNELSDCLKTHNCLRVLDIGCWDGKLLRTMPDSWCFSGIEPNLGAATIARLHNIKVYNELLESAPLEYNSFGIVLMMDLWEHLDNPVLNMKKVNDILMKGGYLFALTGNSETIVARIVKSNWYYFNYIEHVHFFTPKSVELMLNTCGFVKRRITKVKHHSASFSNTFSRLLTYTINKSNPQISKLSTPKNMYDMIGVALSRIFRLKDHLFIVAVKE